jgi:hypothetical protein
MQYLAIASMVAAGETSSWPALDACSLEPTQHHAFDCLKCPESTTVSILSDVMAGEKRRRGEPVGAETAWGSALCEAQDFLAGSHPQVSRNAHNLLPVMGSRVSGVIHMRVALGVGLPTVRARFCTL